MREALIALNQLVLDGVIENYAIGGAVGAAFYIEALRTEDVDAFVFMPPTGSGFLSLSPVYEALLKCGGVIEREYVRFGQWPLQILPDANSLIREAIVLAGEVDFDGAPTRIFRAEHLCAIALQTGRMKDYLRVQMFLDQGSVDRMALRDLLDRFGVMVETGKLESF